MQDYLKLIILLIQYQALKLLYIFPVKEYRIFLESYNGKSMSCNPYYLYLELKSKYPTWEYVWCSNQSTNEIKSVRFHSWKYYYYVLTSAVYITNNTVPCMPFRKSQFVISTWHGGGAYKRVGSALSEWSAYQAKKKYLSANCTSLFVSSSQKFTEVMSSSFYIEEKKFCPIGMPRNDIFFRPVSISKALENVRRYYNIHDECKVVLYAPTYRKIGEENHLYLDPQKIIEALQMRYKHEYVFLFRGHYHTRNIDKNTKNIIDASDYPYMQELLCATDVLISDYSSCIWDFSYTYRPCFLFVPDLNSYESNRDFYAPIDTWRFPLAKTEDDLIAIIENFDLSSFINNMEKHHNDLGSYEKGTATKSLCDIISGYLGG